MAQEFDLPIDQTVDLFSFFSTDGNGILYFLGHLHVHRVELPFKHEHVLKREDHSPLKVLFNLILLHFQLEDGAVGLQGNVPLPAELLEVVLKLAFGLDFLVLERFSVCINDWEGNIKFGFHEVVVVLFQKIKCLLLKVPPLLENTPHVLGVLG